MQNNLALTTQHLMPVSLRPDILSCVARVPGCLTSMASVISTGCKAGPSIASGIRSTARGPKWLMG